MRRCYEGSDRVLALRNVNLTKCHRGYSVQLKSKVALSAGNLYKQRKASRRLLDGLESVFHEYHKIGVGFSYLLTPIKSKIPIEEEALRQALTMVSYRQPLLRATIKKIAEFKYFECTEGRASFGLSTLDRNINDQEEITEEIFEKTKFESDDGPLWKAVLIPGKYDATSGSYNGGLALAISHAIANAPSLTVVLKDTFGYLENIHNGTAPKLEDIDSLPLFPSSASLLSHKLQELCPTSDNIPSSNNYVNPVLSQFPTIEGKPQKSDPRTKVLVRTIPPDQASNLIQQCRKHHSTITGAFLAACHFSFTSCLDNTIQISPTATNDITCLTAVGRNHHPNLPEDYVSCHFGSLTYDITLPSQNKDFWQVAQSLTLKLRMDTTPRRHAVYFCRIFEGFAG